MKYVSVARTCCEPDNNTPSNEVWLKIVECEPSEVSKLESIFANDFLSDGCADCEVELIPYDTFKDEWFKVSEQW